MIRWFVWLFFMSWAVFAVQHWRPYLGTGVGFWDVSVGVHVWTDRLDWRNLQFQHMTYLNPGVRLNSVIRSNNDVRDLDQFRPYTDELYLESFGFLRYDFAHGQAAYSLKVGQMRYLRFPMPDMTSMFDQIPGIEDLQGYGQTAYKGVMGTIDYVQDWGGGVHATWLHWIDSDQTGLASIEQYLVWRTQWYGVEVECRWGMLQARRFPLGRGSDGYSVYVGSRSVHGYKVGVLYEFLHKEGIRTGILVEFASSPVTRFMGKYRMDYTRQPEGLGFHPTLFKGDFGFISRPPANGRLIGTIQAERTITYWQNGQGRNFYEHIQPNFLIPHSRAIRVVKYESPRYLRIESLVSPHNRFKSWDDLKQWEKQRQGPAQLAEPVRYELYEVNE